MLTDVLVSSAAGTAIGTLLIRMFTRPIAKTPISIGNSFWPVCIAKVIAVPITIGLGYVLYEHLLLGLVLAITIEWFVRAVILQIAVRSANATLPSAKAYILSLIVSASDLLIVSPVTVLIKSIYSN
jgi:hypothetical protein